MNPCGGWLLPGATALEQARAAGKFTPVHDAWWAAVRKVHGDRDGTRALIQVLLLHRHNRDVSAAAVTSLTERRLAHLPPDTRPLPSVTIYDQLLPSHRTPREGTRP
ncbi:Mobile element protein [Amycolatopsis camponoti]|uniref:Mobile element protein n=1 Tax=Amycolatopsis camponoti TaxID=2606593 RepID=A0A6I8LKZ8_9PSEU|nr:Mobile element protein [Amycolatopsis camponoti]